jgi:hypothetical protein
MHPLRHTCRAPLPSTAAKWSVPVMWRFVSQPPSGPPPEGREPPYGSFPAYGPDGTSGGPYGTSGPHPPYGPGGPYGSAPYYGPPPPRSGGRRGLVVGLVAGAIVIVVCVVITAVLVLRDDGNKPHTPTALPSGVTATVGADGTMTMAKPGVDRPLVDVYVDYQCPICRTFYQLNESTPETSRGRAGRRSSTIRS